MAKKLSYIPPDDPILSKTHNYYDESKIYTHLLRNKTHPYITTSIPITNSQPLDVHLNLYIQEIGNFDQKLQTLDVNVWMPIGWYDERLKWDPNLFGNVTDIRVNVEDIWVPDIVLYNPADGKFQFEDGDAKQVMVRVYHDGLCKWTPPVKYSISCPLSLKYFPFDVQMCRLHLGSWVHSIERLTLHEFSWNVSNTEYFIDNNIWYMEDSKSIFRGVSYGEYNQNSETYGEAHFFFIMSRNYQMYFINIVVSATLMAGLCFLSFYVPVESGERLALPLSIIIAISVYQLMAAEIIPTGTDTIPILSLFLLSLLILVNCSIIATMLSLKLTFGGKTIKPPVWVFILLVVFVGKIFNIKCCHEYKEWEKIEVEENFPVFEKARRLTKNVSFVFRKKENNHSNRRISVVSIDSHHSSKNLTNSEQNYLNKCELEWKLIGIVVDRICMSLYVMFLVGSFTWLMVFSGAKRRQIEEHRRTVERFMEEGDV